jgi:hypothetical protein
LEQKALGAFAEKLFTDALNNALKEGREKLLKKLEITDPMEAALFSGSLVPEPSNSDEKLGEVVLWSVYLVQPGKETKEPRTIALLLEGKPFIRFTRTTAPVDSPMAVMSMTGTMDGRLTQSEILLIYTRDRKWKKFPSSERKANLRDDEK